MRELTPLDRLLGGIDLTLRAATRTGLSRQRPTPGAELPQAVLDRKARRHAAGLMRVNHAGEVCAQALYVGQAIVARGDETAQVLLTAAAEEGDHLFWCEDRLAELESKPSLLNPLWFAGSYAIGVAAAAAGDRVSLGFVEETERQVVAHLEGHLGELPAGDLRSRAVVVAMRDDEARHADEAVRRGALRLPLPVRAVMKVTARVMTTLAYWF